MARWIINRPEEHSNPGEIAVARHLRSLSDRWIVRWGFYYTDERGQTREGDFLILGPHGGLLVLEVKGGRVHHFTSTGNWETDVAMQHDHPLFQLDAEWKAVIDAFHEAEAGGGGTPVIKQALCVPNELAKEHAKSWMGIPRARVIAGNDLRSFATAWRRCFPDPDREVWPRERETFLDLYGEGSRPEKVREFIDHTEHRFREQFTRSYRLLDTLSANRQLLVRGGPGTGKTWLAIEQACRLAENAGGDTGRDVLFLCYNKALAKHLGDLLNPRRLTRGAVRVQAWEALGDRILADCGIDNQPPAPDAPAAEKARYYGEELPGILLECVSDPQLLSRLPRFDALVVDEAQDHDTGWWPVYFGLLREGTEAPMALFYDPAQRPPFRSPDGFDIGAIASRLSQPAFATLPRTLRYTRQIYEYLQGLDAPGTRKLLAAMGDPENLPEGPEVVRVQAPKAGTAAAVEKLLAKWESDGLCRPHEVILLHLHREVSQTALGAVDHLAGLPLVEATGTDGGTPMAAIRHTTIHRAKGLDATAVILVGLRPFEELSSPDFQHTHFMGASRAKQVLGIVETVSE